MIGGKLPEEVPSLMRTFRARADWRLKVWRIGELVSFPTGILHFSALQLACILPILRARIQER